MNASPTSRKIPALLIAGVVAGALVAALAVLPSGAPADGAPAGSSPATALPEDPSAAATAYLSAVEPLARDGGRIVEQGMKPGLVDIGDGARPDDLLIDSAEAWADQMRQVKAKWRALSPPDGLVDAHDRFVEALDGYIGVAVLLEEAARVSVDARGPFTDLAASEGERADDLWDDAASDVQDHLRSLGLDPVTWLSGAPQVSGTDPSPGTPK